MGPIFPVRDELADHGVIVHRNFRALLDARVDAHVRPLGLWVGGNGLTIRGQLPNRWHVIHRVLSVDTGFNGPAVDPDVVLGNGERLSRGHTDHLLHKVDAGDALCNGVLHLQPSVHLEEVKVLVGVNEELDGASRLVVDSAREGNRLLAHRSSGLGVQERRWRLLDNLLVPPLDRALSFVQVHIVAMLVTKHLDLNVAGLVDEFLHQEVVISKRLGLTLRQRVPLLKIAVIPRRSHALATTAMDRLDHDRVSNVIGDLLGVLHISHNVGTAGNHADSCGLGLVLGILLISHHLDRKLARPKELHPLVLERLGKGRILGQEAVPRMHRVGPRRIHGLEQLVHPKIRLGGWRRAKQKLLVSHAHVHAVGVCFGIHGDRLNAKLLASAHHPARDLAAVRHHQSIDAGDL
mmetsp:Transcript_5903/g.15018  ORF Transcript_5903/g.15018 Transcript_5903/m.15018 type:complete len:407 (-) Transcript_5903:169-1389(-)